MKKLEECVQKSQFSNILCINFDQKCLRGKKCLLMRSLENVIKYNWAPFQGDPHITLADVIL